MWNFLLAFIPRAIVQGIPLLYGSTGEIITEKSGNLNLGIPGVMYVGAISGVIGSFFYEISRKRSSHESGAGSSDTGAVLSAGFPVNGTAVLLPDSYTSSKSECNRSCHDYLWCWLW